MTSLGQAHNQAPERRKPARCQPITVSGLTIRRTADQRGQKRRKVVQNSRSPDVQERPRSRSLAFEHSDLLAESQDFQGCIGSYPEGGAERNEEGEEAREHELTV